MASYMLARRKASNIGLSAKKERKEGEVRNEDDFSTSSLS